jgi:hypothetical protein
MHLAGTPSPHPEIKFSTLVVKKYREAGWRRVLIYKRSSFEALFDNADFAGRVHELRHYFFAGNRAKRAAEVAQIRDTMFLRWFWSIDVLSFVILLWLVCVVARRPRSPDFRKASVLWICVAFSLLIWCLLMFAGGTIVHQGCYFTSAVLVFFAALSAIAFVLVLWKVRNDSGSDTYLGSHTHPSPTSVIAKAPI